MTEKRVKIKVEHARKMFYEKFLSVWREETDDHNQKHTLYKAMHSLKQYPLEVEGISELKRIQGIGEVLASRCDAAWIYICSERKTDQLNHSAVKSLTNEELKLVVKKSKSLKRQALDEMRNKLPSKVPCVPQEDEFVEPSSNTGSQTLKRKNSSEKNSKTSGNNSKDMEFIDLDDYDEPQKAASSNQSSQNSVSSNDSSSSSQQSVRYLSCRPYQQPEVILIVDSREIIGNKRGKTIAENLAKSTIRYEQRPLSVGDFLWVARLIDGSELVLDWIIERKTWDDLQSSIRKGRYEEQKSRINKSPMQNRVYLVEGRGSGDVACEQAIATTITKDGFMVKRCDTGRDSVHFFQSITDLLQKQVSSQEVTGICYADLQDLAKKTKAETVRDIWIRQLTVCPGLSTNKAQAIAECFPSFASLLKHFNDNGQQAVDKLILAVPGITKGVAQQLAKFFA